jgi:hypothetical protein
MVKTFWLSFWPDYCLLFFQPGRLRSRCELELSWGHLGSRIETAESRQTGAQPLLLPLVFTAGLAGLSFLSPIRRNPRLLMAFLGAAALLCAWNAVLVLSRRKGRLLTLQVVAKKQHYLQACAQGSVLLYWGWYWPPVYAFAPFILAQLLFAYAFDMLLTCNIEPVHVRSTRRIPTDALQLIR